LRERPTPEAVTTALGRSGGNIARAAAMLGITRPTLYDLLTRLRIEVER
jgi:two-component system, NtrC family, response regulator